MYKYKQHLSIEEEQNLAKLVKDVTNVHEELKAFKYKKIPKS